MTPSRVLVLGFAMVILFGALLLTLTQATQDGLGLPFLNATFTATTSVCVTGLVVVDTGTTFTLFGQCVILLLIQVGGLGFMTFATLLAMILGRRITLKERLVYLPHGIYKSKNLRATPVRNKGPSSFLSIRFPSDCRIQHHQFSGYV